MKTFNNIKIPLRCTKLSHWLKTGLSDLPSLFSSSDLLLPLSLLVKRMSLNRSALVNKVVAFLAMIQGMVKSRLLNGRIFIVLTLFGFSPFAACLHMLFDRKQVVAGWYHGNYFHLLNLLGPYLFFLVVLIGICLLIPPKQKTFKVFKKSLDIQLSRIMFIPIGITIAKLIWLYNTKSNEDFWSIPNWSYFGVGLFVGYISYLLIEWLTWRKYHAFDGLVASILGLYEIDISEEIRREKVKPLLKELREFHSKY